MFIVRFGGLMLREGRQIEYKEKIVRYESLCKTVVAFSNDIGGTLTIGIKDGSLKVTGLCEEEIERLYEEIPKAVYDALTPYCLPEITTKIIDSHEVLEINIRKGDRKPYFIKSEGIPKGVYLRIGSHNRRVTPELMEDLQREAANRFWDSELTDIAQESLEPLQLQQFYPDGRELNLLAADKIIGLKPLSTEYTITNGGLVYFHENPAEHLPQCEILYTEFKDTTMDKIVVTKDLQGPLPVLVQKVIALLQNHIVATEKMVGMRRIPDKFKIPEIVIREVILNALIHRKYTIQDAIKIAVFSDRIEVFSPGNFPGPINLAELGNGISYARNPAIRHLARKAGLVEKRGMGFLSILRECKKNGNRRPLVVEGPDFVKVTLYFEQSESMQAELSKEYFPLSSYRQSNQPIQTSEVKELLRVSINTARQRLYELVESGFLEQRGKGRASKYYWKK
jgi:ATP-dependent DNA helicase RecG